MTSLANTDLRLIPLDQIDAHALPRDRRVIAEEDITTLADSIRDSGLRQPIEVYTLSTSKPPFTYGLISGFRRLTAVQRLGHDKVQAFVRSPETYDQAFAEMVGENEIRVQISPWEKARLVLTAVQGLYYPTPDAAIEALYPMLSRQSHYRMRGHVDVVQVFDKLLQTPERLTSRQMDRLAIPVRNGWENLLLTALAELKSPSLDTQWQALLPLITESTTSKTAGDSPRPRRLLHLKKGLTIRREHTQHGYALRFSGPEARRGGLMDDVMDYVERWFGEG
ncbi:ParB/RepB/Spo0J family partition protein [Pseudotabrizicola formosa]|uniref:ParB/RepB/Spo0J family partition protein n=1 Tax=Pseudotabrizicola formosa TaxID=2030009 RepID=UPI00143CD213|nr:ParB N-terminal domain-containing protein [Pseudotabrizicola formosa]